MSLRTNSFTLECKNALDQASEIFQEYDGCYLYTPTQIFHAIKRMLSYDQQARFENAIRTDNTTLGVAGYEPENPATVSETAKALSLSSYTIVIADEPEKSNIHVNKRTVCVTPREFLAFCNEAKQIYSALKIENTVFTDYLTLVLFRKDICEPLKKIIPS